ncbi:hypothetical protein HQ393_06810 [Chitinibacter bivalviorum]|uniref:DUF7931 domain-containing protein n=1 Tax=Chitinibacter bivalviorum TaxID=2739434 RepID=A0A7H9BGZ8_9NEIS|nr:hypothetical protein [Chitinibacter bivalviorum]QLG87993.1 hypothetical protein HQ393_06810 [Chitinibacter bivalviorum]
MNMDTSNPLPDKLAQPFDTRAGYQAAFSAIISQAGHTLLMCEKDFAEIDLGCKRNFDLLWAFFSQPSPGRLQLLMQDSDYLGRHCPRFMQLYDRFTHLIELRVIPEHLRQWQKGWVVSDHKSYLIRHHYDWYRGELANDPQIVALLRQQFATLWEQSTSSNALQRLDL